MTTDNEEPNSRLPDYILKIVVFLFKSAFLRFCTNILRLKLDTFNFEYIPIKYELSQSVRMIEIKFLSTFKKNRRESIEFYRVKITSNDSVTNVF